MALSVLANLVSEPSASIAPSSAIAPFLAIAPSSAIVLLGHRCLLRRDGRPSSNELFAFPAVEALFYDSCSNQSGATTATTQALQQVVDGEALCAQPVLGTAPAASNDLVALFTCTGDADQRWVKSGNRWQYRDTKYCLDISGFVGPKVQL